MQGLSKTIIFRHKKENLKKCSLRGLEGREGFIFYSYPLKEWPDLSHCLLLTLDAPPLTKEDVDHDLLILDATWRYAGQMLKSVLTSGQQIEKRSLPSCYRTAYPRRQLDCADPKRGLASIEAIYIAHHILGRDTTGLLDNYYWKDLFMEKNMLCKED
jgi:pre-rRNA-processing protein TSR3